MDMVVMDIMVIMSMDRMMIIPVMYMESIAIGHKHRDASPRSFPLLLTKNNSYSSYVSCLYAFRNHNKYKHFLIIINRARELEPEAIEKAEKNNNKLRGCEFT